MKVDNDIAQFWEWFSSISTTLSNNPEEPTLLRVLDQRIMKIGEFSWEIGPGVTKNWSLVISGTGDKNLERLADTIIRRAPENNNWEFYSSRPPKLWDLQFEMEDEKGRPIQIDARGWRYVLARTQEGNCFLTIEASNVEHLSPDMRIRAAEIAVEGELGEKTARERIENIEVTLQLDPNLRSKSTEFKHLSAHLSQIGVK